MTMTAKEFFNTVASMRDAQKEYFKTRSKEALVNSKMLESMVDKEISRVKELLREMKGDGTGVWI